MELNQENQVVSEAMMPGARSQEEACVDGVHPGPLTAKLAELQVLLKKVDGQDHLLLKYQIGLVVAELMDAPQKYGAKAVETAAMQAGRDADTFRDHERVTRAWPLDEFNPQAKRLTSKEVPQSFNAFVVIAKAKESERKGLLDRAFDEGMSVAALKGAVKELRKPRMKNRDVPVFFKGKDAGGSVKARDGEKSAVRPLNSLELVATAAQALKDWVATATPATISPAEAGQLLARLLAVVGDIDVVRSHLEALHQPDPDHSGARSNVAGDGVAPAAQLLPTPVAEALERAPDVQHFIIRYAPPPPPGPPVEIDIQRFNRALGLGSRGDAKGSDVQPLNGDRTEKEPQDLLVVVAGGVQR